MKRRKEAKINLSELWGLGIIGFGIFVFLSLISYNPNDVNYYLNPPNRPTHNLMGPVGAWVAFALYFTIGFSAYLVPIFSILWGTLRLKKLPFKKRPDIYIFAWCLALLSICGLLTIFEKAFNITQNLKLISIGGITGTIIGERVTVKYFGTIGATLIMSAICIIAFVYITEIRLWLLVKWLIAIILKCAKWIYNIVKLISIKIVIFVKNTIEQRRKKKKAVPIIKSAPQISQIKPQPQVSAKDVQITKEPQQKEKPIPVSVRPKPQETGAGRTKFVLPPIDILEPPPAVTQRDSKEDLTQNAKVLEAALREFGITVEVTGIQPGPVVTLYELVLAPGIKIGKVTSLSYDIALAMRVASVRIIAPIPGKSAIGIEVPNTKPRFVYLREVVSTQEFQRSDAKIPLALGMDVSGNPLISDLVEMPHLLVAGTTGSGKTVCLNAIILSILLRLKPDEVKFLMVDPKMVELAIYKNLPHLLVPVIHNPKKASLGLTWVVREMERRYELFARAGVRNIEGYNTRPESKKEGPELPSMEEGLLEIDYEKEPPSTLPYIIIIIDELADLMMVAPADIEIAIGRLAQLSRAVGIHIILATQRPSVDVLTGVIKANFSTRISFQVASRVDSRTVIDSSGADMLLGKGDMLFMPPGSSKLVRAQCSLVRDMEISKVVDFILSQKKAQFGSIEAKDVVFQKLQDLKESSEEEDPLFKESVDVILTTQQASVSVLQRKLKIGYNRAARIVDMMEIRGIVGPLEDGKREILITDERFAPHEPQTTSLE